MLQDISFAVYITTLGCYTHAVQGHTCILVYVSDIKTVDTEYQVKMEAASKTSTEYQPRSGSDHLVGGTINRCTQNIVTDCRPHKDALMVTNNNGSSTANAHSHCHQHLHSDAVIQFTCQNDHMRLSRIISPSQVVTK